MHLRRVAQHGDGGHSPLAGHPALRTYAADLAGTRGLAVREEVFGTGHAYAELAEPAIEAVTSPDDPVDLLVLAYGVPDVQPGRNTALHLAARCPGRPSAFAICDQGIAAAFTALRLVADHDVDRAVLVVAEQTAVPYPLVADAPVPERHSAVALLLERGPAPVVVRQHSALPADAVDAVLAADLAELCGERDDVRLVLGPGVDGAGADLPYTGMWARLGDGEPGGLRVFADYDPGLGYLCVAALETSPRPAALVAAAGAPGTGGGVADMAVKD
jgi:4-hydroxymandelate oxidase